ncbi:DUF4870 domain-containing protein [Candidatus Altiarchaeota archaeon]
MTPEKAKEDKKEEPPKDKDTARSLEEKAKEGQTGKPDGSKPEDKDESKPAKKDESGLMAALGHGLGIFIPILVPLIIWLTQKDKSKYIDYQAKQAMLYQFTIFVVSVGVSIIVIPLSVLGPGICCMPLVLIMYVGFIAYGIYAAVKTYNMEDFKYAVIGDLIKKE